MLFGELYTQFTSGLDLSTLQIWIISNTAQQMNGQVGFPQNLHEN